ncbi:MAG: hypothetical protein QNJ41_05100 [Xenococcaceae cyanobacterium MO_188.B32]|nr:hypothetical protein [Xenococcaceae cyanobacterium MO_188.B32]
MEKPVLEKAKNLGFPYQLQEENCWQILPKRRGATWKLISAMDSQWWILSLRNIPQLYLNSEEAIAFLATRARRL